MSTTATATLSITTSYQNATTSGTGGSNTDSAGVTYSAPNTVTGTSTGQIDTTWSQPSTTLTATTAVLTLSALTGPLGATVAFVKITELSIFNDATTSSNTLTVGGNGTNPIAALFGDAASDKIKIPAGGCLILTAPVEGFAVASGSADRLKFDSGAGTVPYRLVIKGRSA